MLPHHGGSAIGAQGFVTAPQDAVEVEKFGRLRNTALESGEFSPQLLMWEWKLYEVHYYAFLFRSLVIHCSIQ